MSLNTEKKVGIFFLLTLIALGVMIEFVEDWNPFEVRHNFKTYFNTAIGIKAGDPVRLAGVDVGKIKAIVLDGSRVRIDFYVVAGTVIKADTVAAVRQTNLLGGQFLGLDFGSEQSPRLPEGSVVQSREGVNIDQLIANLDRNQEKVLGAFGDIVEETRGPLIETVSHLENISRKVDSGEGTLGRLVNDPQLYDSIAAGATDLRTILARLERGEGTLGLLLHDPTLYAEASKAVANLRELSDRVKGGEGTVGRFFKDDVLYANANDALANIKEISAKANQGRGTFGRLVNDDALYTESHSAVSRINSIAGKIDDGKGTLGRLVNEDDLYRDAKTTLHKVEKTVDNLSDQGPISALGVVVGTLF